MTTTFKPSQPKTARYWLDICRQHGRTSYLKVAGIAGQGSDEDTPFEQAMSNLAHATLRDRAPGLLEYELGFQLIEKNEDNDKAVGIFGFKLGPQLLYAPVFFLGGELKGHELLYLKSSDTFVPLSEGWINYLLARKPLVLGESISQAATSRGSRTPDLRMLRQSPTSKLGSVESWVSEALPAVAYLSDPQNLGDFEPKLPALLQKNSACAVSFMKMLDAYPQLIEKYAEAYGPEFLPMALDSAKAYYTVAPNVEHVSPRDTLTGSIVPAEKRAAVDPTRGGKLQIFVYGEKTAGLSDEEKTALVLERVMIKDARDDSETSRVFDINEQGPMSLSTPDATGVYDVLMKPGDFAQCFVAVNPRRAMGLPATIVVKLDGKDWISCNSVKIWADDNGKPQNKDLFKEWWDGLEKADSLESGGTYLLIGPRGQTLGPLEANNSLPSKDGENVYRVWFRGNNGAYDTEGSMYQVSRRGNESYSLPSGPEAISLGYIGGEALIERTGIYYVPKDWKKLKLADREGNSDTFRPGDMVDVTTGIIAKTAELKVWADSIEAEVNGRRMTRMAAKLHLVRDHGLREKSAADVLNAATKSRGGRYRIKYADEYTGSPFDQYGGGFAMPAFPEQQPVQDSFMGTGFQTIEPQIDELPVQSMYPTDNRSMSDPPMPDPDAMNQVMQASQVGQKEVLDTSSMAAMLRTRRGETLVDQHLGDLLTGLDRIGRLLFNFYWRNDVFADRYGDDELHEIEDLLRTNFENLGDLVLKLRQETIEPFPGEALGNTSGGEYMEA